MDWPCFAECSQCPSLEGGSRRCREDVESGWPFLRLRICTTSARRHLHCHEGGRALVGSGFRMLRDASRCFEMLRDASSLSLFSRSGDDGARAVRRRRCGSNTLQSQDGRPLLVDRNRACLRFYFSSFTAFIECCCSRSEVTCRLHRRSLVVSLKPRASACTSARFMFRAPVEELLARRGSSSK